MQIINVINKSKSVTFVIDDDGNEYNITMNRNTVESIEDVELMERLKIIVNDRKQLMTKESWKCYNTIIGNEL